MQTVIKFTAENGNNNIPACAAISLTTSHVKKI